MNKENKATHVVDFEDDPRLHDPRGQHIDWEDLYIDRDDNHHIATHVADGDFNRRSATSASGGGAPTGCLKPFLIGAGIFVGFGLIINFVITFIIPVIAGLSALFGG